VKRFLFLCVHPDDLEFNCSVLMHHLAEKGYSIEILCLTKGEFGIFEEEWKGPRLAKIREQELKDAAKINSISPDHVHFGDIIDGFVKFDKETIQKVGKYINKLKPDIIFAPEAYFTYYWHPDHINCGRMAYYLYKVKPELLDKKIESLYFYTTMMPNFLWPSNDLERTNKAFFQHQSQWWLLKWNSLFNPFDKFNVFWNRIGRWKYAERYRRIYKDKKEPEPTLLARALLTTIYQLNVINPPEEHFKVPRLKGTDFYEKVMELREKYDFDD